MPNFNALLKQARQQQDAGYTMPLTATFLGVPEEDRFDLHLRRLSMNDPSWIESVPQALRGEINRALSQFQQAQKRAQAEGNREPERLEDRFRDNPIVIQGANAFCVAVAIEPRLYLHAQDEHGPDDVWVGDIHVDDRMDIFLACLNAESEGAKKLKVFRGRTEPAARSGATGAVAAEPVRGAAHVYDTGVDGDVPVAIQPNGRGILERVSGDR